MDLVEVLALVFMLGSLELGRVGHNVRRQYTLSSHGLQAYSTSNLSETQITMLRDLRDYGLVYTPGVSFASHSSAIAN